MTLRSPYSLALATLLAVAAPRFLWAQQRPGAKLKTLKLKL
ncbi:hypothetical protein [Hymenobacter radiodurans]|nr:hypothetical protein [Hymenobacter radiodurans]